MEVVTLSSEKQLIKKAKRGDIKAFEKLVADYQVYCYNIALGMLRSKEDAKDISQEALIKVFNKLAAFDEKANFSTWLYRIVVNSCLDFIKKQQKLRLVDTPYDEAIETSVDKSAESVESQVIKGELAEIIKRSLEKLTAEQRLPIILRDYLGLSYDDVAETLQLPLGTVKSRLMRGRKKLREIVIRDKAFSYSLINREEVI